MNEHKNCKCHQSSNPFAQSLEELEFERSIHNACVQNNFDRVLKLQDQFDLYDTFGYTPLHYASRAGNLKIVEFLVGKGANINAKTKFGEVTSLHRACLGNHIEVAQFLLQHGGDLDSKDVDGRTPRDIIMQMEGPTNLHLLL